MALTVFIHKPQFIIRMNLIGQSAVIFLSLLNCVACQLQLQCYQKPKWFKKCPIVVPQAQTLQTSLIILVDLTVLILSDKLILDIQLTHTFMPNMIHTPWMVSSTYVPLHISKARAYSPNTNYIYCYLAKVKVTACRMRCLATVVTFGCTKKFYS